MLYYIYNGVRGGLVVTFATVRMPRSEVQTPSRAEIWIETSAPCAPLLRRWDTWTTTSGTRANPNKPFQSSGCACALGRVS